MGVTQTPWCLKNLVNVSGPLTVVTQDYNLCVRLDV